MKHKTTKKYIIFAAKYIFSMFMEVKYKKERKNNNKYVYKKFSLIYIHSTTQCLYYYAKNDIFMEIYKRMNIILR